MNNMTLLAGHPRSQRFWFVESVDSPLPSPPLPSPPIQTQWVQLYNIIYKKSTCIHRKAVLRSTSSNSVFMQASQIIWREVRTGSMMCVDST